MSVVCGAASIPMTPPFSAQAWITLSGFIRLVSQSARASVGDEDRLVAGGDGVERGLVAGVRDVDRDPELIHSPHRLVTEDGEAAVARLAQAAPQGVRLAVRDPARADPQAVKDVEAVDLVLDRGGRLERGDERDLAVRLGPPNVGHRIAPDDEVLVRDVGVAHPEVVDHVVPLPPHL